MQPHGSFFFIPPVKIEEEIKQTRFRNEHQKAIINVLFTASWLENRQASFFKSFGITGAQFNILRILRGYHPHKMSGVEIKSRMIDRNSDVSRLLDRLIAKGYAEKSQCPKDKRASDIIITASGMNLLDEIDHSIDAHEKVLGLSSAEAKQLNELLDKCRA